ncbi:MAG: hypothetical protein MUO72_14335 [Bacteroidales bacterium]|nr:hypothetical protein [Bacteroidales bacterium]
MSHPKFDRNKLFIRKLAERKNQVFIEKDHIPLTARSLNLSKKDKGLIKRTSDKIRSAREKNKSVILAFGAHAIKNGLAPVLIELIKKGWVTHLATNGAGIIHDWEFAFQGKSGEDVRENVKNGQFGIWEETGLYINLALLTGAFEGLGYGESIGKMIFQEGLHIPEPEFLLGEANRLMESDPEHAAAAIDLCAALRKNNLKSGFLSIPHPFKKYSVQCSAYDLKIPFTGHPMIGHDIIYNHPANHGAAIGRTALTDFLYFAHSVSHIDHGVYISVGSAIMSPMIFEKALSMSQNLEIQRKNHIDNHYMIIVDLAKTEWDWAKNGEPPSDNPSYYLRYCKTFNRMGGEMHYLTADNRDFLLELYHDLSEVDSV